MIPNASLHLYSTDGCFFFFNGVTSSPSPLLVERCVPEMMMRHYVVPLCPFQSMWKLFRFPKGSAEREQQAIFSPPNSDCKEALDLTRLLYSWNRFFASVQNDLKSESRCIEEQIYVFFFSPRVTRVRNRAVGQWLMLWATDREIRSSNPRNFKLPLLDLLSKALNLLLLSYILSQM